MLKKHINANCVVPRLACLRGRFGVLGFTLIELVAVLIILGIIAVFAIGRLDFASTFNQKGVRDKAVAALQFARKASVAQRRNICVTLTVSNQLKLMVDTRAPETTGATFCDGSSSTDLALPAPDRDCGGAGTNLVCSKTGATIGAFSGVTLGGAGFCFDAQGRGLSANCQSASTAILSVTGQNSVTVEGETGYVH